MRKFVTAAIISLVLAGPASAADCGAGSAKIDDSSRKFSVVVPKSSGLGGEQVYDDIGCAVVSRNSECAMRQSMFDGAAMVFDHLTGAEVPAEKAFFVLGTGARTPQGFGIVAFRDRTEAEKYSAARGKGKVVKWFELVDENIK